MSETPSSNKRVIVFLTCITLIGVLIAIGASTDFTFKVGGKTIQSPDLQNSTTIKIQNISNVVFFHVNNTVIALQFSNGSQFRNIVNLLAGSGITLQRNDNNITIISTGSSGCPISCVLSILIDNNSTGLTGNIRLLNATGISMTKEGQNITISSTISGGGACPVTCVLSLLLDNNSTKITGDIRVLEGSGITITKNSQNITIRDSNNTSLLGSTAILVSKVGNTITISDINNTSTKAGSGILVSKSGNVVTISDINNTSILGSTAISISKVGNILTITDINNTSIKGSTAITVSKSGNVVTITDVNNTSVKCNVAISCIKSGNVVTFTDINNTSIKAGSGISISKSGNVVTIADINNTSIVNGTKGLVITKSGNVVTLKVNPMSDIIMWRSDARSAIAGQGLNLAAALTELDNSNDKSSRKDLNPNMLGLEVSCSVKAFVDVLIIGGTINVTIRDTSNTANVLCFRTFSAANLGSNSGYSAFENLPSWFTADTTLAVYTQGGDGAGDFVFSNVSIYTRAGVG